MIRLANEWRLIGAGLLAFISWDATAYAGCKSELFNNHSYSVCSFDVRNEHVELFNLDQNDIPLGSFERLSQKLKAEGKSLTFAMNAGMYDQNLRPIGLYVENGVEAKKLNRKNGGGNFHLKPNGVFYVAGGKVGVMETDAYAKSGIQADFATQSGPMLVINNKIHPRLSPTGTSFKIRNGVGVMDDHTAMFVISNDPVQFYEFASVFRDQLGCKNALFLDGSISSLYSSEISGVGGYVPLGPIVGVYTSP